MDQRSSLPFVGRKLSLDHIIKVLEHRRRVPTNTAAKTQPKLVAPRLPREWRLALPSFWLNRQVLLLPSNVEQGSQACEATNFVGQCSDLLCDLRDPMCAPYSVDARSRAVRFWLNVGPHLGRQELGDLPKNALTLVTIVSPNLATVDLH